MIQQENRFKIVEYLFTLFTIEKKAVTDGIFKEFMPEYGKHTTEHGQIGFLRSVSFGQTHVDFPRYGKMYLFNHKLPSPCTMLNLASTKGSTKLFQ